ncbi:MAG: ATP-grasp domain-containing protein, partial [Planctomycetia bacterium]|nr:ATP-grasp domain-containing protein [Planctomycetia bacterium]
ELWGNGPDVLKKVRDPFAVQECMAGFRRTRPRTILPGESADPSLRWLRKPIRGSAGLGVRFADSDDFPSQAEKPNYYLQEFLEGVSMSAVFAHGRRGWPTFVGMSRQLIGTDWLHAKPFAYAGNVMVDPNVYPDPRPTAGWLTHSFSLAGVWGLDAIRTGDEWNVVEINPRYTASVELYELATNSCTLVRWEPIPPAIRMGKAIYFAPHRIVFPASGPWDDSLARCADVWRRPDFADLPHAGDIIEAGQPVLTIFAEADDEEACEAKLKASAAELDRLFAVG